MNPIPYDFRKPVRLPAEWHKLLLGWLQTSAALASRGWTKQLGVPLKLSVGPLEDYYAQAALALLAADNIGQRIMIGTGQVATMLVLPRSVLLNLVGVMLGEEQTQNDRELTIVEDQLADYFLDNHWLPYFRESWPGPAPLLWQLHQRETQPAFSRLFAPSEALVKLNWQVHGPFGVGQGQWFFPREALLQALKKEQEMNTAAGAEQIAAARKAQIVRTMPLSIACVLGTVQLRVSELSGLQPGDVVLLDQQISDHVTAWVGGRQLFHGQVGRNGSWKAFRIESFIER